jgi:dCMP deaminase
MRPERDLEMLAHSCVTATRSTCRRRQVGAVITDVDGVILATGRNGAPKGQPHCLDNPCDGAHLPSGTGLSACEAVHAEVNAVLFCTERRHMRTLYCTTSPCSDCVKLLLQTPIQRLVFLDQYPHAEARDRWLRAGRAWEHWQGDDPRRIFDAPSVA